MKRYEVTFCKAGTDNEMIFIARAVAGAKSVDEAVRVTYELLKPKYPEIEIDERFVGYSPDFAMAYPDQPCELELATH
ncbi:hypothetical protein [Salinivibrio sp. ML290]|uniref:hypothetical protein n=1 Tax=Salinivibrio sp. ML290 TaxID=1909468 RepID=UPI00098854E7|nr:hypothetical protein [Salinivibrio sp. ML290]OOE74272.1 hypothetical protein BZG23_08995 [Salinivibrio sp. ML290]